MSSQDLTEAGQSSLNPKPETETTIDPTQAATEQVESGLLDAPTLRQKFLDVKKELAQKRREVNELSLLLIETTRLLELAEAIEEKGVNPGHYAPAAFNLSGAEVVERDPAFVTLQVTIQVEGKVPKSTYNFDVPANEAPTLDELRKAIVDHGADNGTLQRMTLWPDAAMDSLARDLRRVTFKLEEDGHAAPMTVTRTNINRETAFPTTEYAAWYYRNVQRGKKSHYEIEVKCVV